MIDIAILRALVAAGAPVEAILSAIEIDQRSEIARVQARRLGDTERQRRKRHAESSGQTVTPRDSADTDAALSFLLPVSSSSKPLQTEKKEEERKKERGARRMQILLPEDWEPKPSHYAAAERGFVERKAQDMRHWAKSKAVVRADWDATFHGFLRPSDRLKGANGHGRPNLEERGRALADKARELERAAGLGPADDAFRGD